MGNEHARPFPPLFKKRGEVKKCVSAKIMSEHQRKIIEYLICCVGAFAQRYKVSNTQAFRYLKTFKGIDFLQKCYEAEHTLSVDDAVEDLTRICARNGGAFQYFFGTEQALEYLKKSDE